MRGIASRPSQIVERARQVLAEAGVAPPAARIVVVGVSYKPGVEDVRESPAVEIMSRLRALGTAVTYVDPYVPQLRIDGAILHASSPADCADVDLAILHTRHTSEDLRWLDLVPRVLDATYRAFDVPNRIAV
jgi:UDP-N-acetyl-D-mannosaminuronate dehydrogenase